MTDGVSVIICTHTEQRWSDLVAAVSSVADQSPRPLEVLVVVDHNDELLGRAMESWAAAPGRAPPVRVVPSSGPPGLSGARNTGVTSATGRVVAFLDDDAVATTGWLDALLAALAGPAVVAVGGGVRPVSEVSPPPWWPHEYDWVIGCSWRGLPGVPSDIRNVIGCNMAFRRQDVIDIGGFSTDVGRLGAGASGDEETDLCIRLRQQQPDARVVYLPQAVVDHHVPGARLTWTYFRRRCVGEGRSKAVLAGRNGASTSLSSEWAYTTRVLPRGVARGLADAARGRPDGVARAAAIVAGLLFTTAGYVWGRLAGTAAVRVR